MRYEIQALVGGFWNILEVVDTKEDANKILASKRKIYGAKKVRIVELKIK